MQRALELATEAPGKADVEARLQSILKVLVKAGGASGATLMLFTGEASQVLALPPLRADPLSRTTWGVAHLDEREGAHRAAPRGGDQLAELAEALRAGAPSFEAVAFVPLRSAERLLGLALLYFGPYAALPSLDRLVHLGFLARVLAGPLEASAAREADLRRRPAEGALEGLVGRRRLAADAPALGARAAAAPPPVQVLGPAGGSGVSVEVRSPAITVLGDAPLLRFAFASLVRQCEADALERGQIPEVSVRVEEEGHAVRVRITGGGRTSVTSAPEIGPDLADAELSVVARDRGPPRGRRRSPVAARARPPHFTVELIRA